MIGELGVEGGFDGGGTALEDVGVDHGGFDVFVSEKFLDGANIVAVLEEVGSKGVAEGVCSDGFLYFRELGGAVNCFLQNAFVEMMAANNA